MAEQVDGIEIVIDVDTQAVIEANKRVGMSIKSIEGRVKQMDTTFKQASNNMSKSAGGVRKGLSGMGRSAGQAGIQIQQLIGQVTAGTNPFVALSQQAADLGFVLGVPLAGAVVSIAAALATVLVPSLFDSGASVDELREKLKRLEEETGLTANQTALLAQEDRKAIEEKQKRIKALKEEIAEQERLNRLRTSAGTGTDTGQFAIPRSAADNAKRYADAIKESEETIVKNKAEVDLLNQDIIELSSNVERYDQGQQEALKKIEQQREFAKKLNQELALIQTKSESGALAAAKLAAAFELGLTNAEMLPPEIDKTLELLFKAEEAEKAAADAAREKAKAEREAQQAAEAANRAYERNLDTIAKQIAELEGSDAAFALWSENMRQSAISAGVSTEAIDAQIAKLRELREEQEREKKDEKDKDLLKTLGVTDEAQIEQERLDQLRELQRLHNEGKLQDEADYLARRNQINAKANEALARLNKQSQMIDWEGFGQRAAGAMAAVASGAVTGEEAMRSLAVTLLTEALGALIKLGIQSAVTSAKTTAAATSSMAATGAASVATTATTAAANTTVAASTAGVVAGIAGGLASAWAPAAFFASTATLGGAAGIGATSLAVGMASTLAIQAIGGILSNAIGAATNISGAGSSIGGGRLYGGGVEAGKLYPITEDGRPEILQQGNKSYLLPGSRGNVVSNKDISMGAPNINIMIDNSAAGVEVVPDVRQNGGQTDVRLTVRAVAADIRRGGEVYSAMKDSFNVKGRTG